MSDQPGPLGSPIEGKSHYATNMPPNAMGAVNRERITPQYLIVIERSDEKSKAGAAWAESLRDAEARK